MRIEKADFETAKHVIDKSRRDKAIVFHTSHFRDFVSHLETRRNESYQTEGLTVTGADIRFLKKRLGELYNNLAERFATQSDEVKRNTNVTDYMLTAHDYMMTVITEGLNYAEIKREDFMSFKDEIEAAATKMIDAKPDVLKSPKEFFNAQRRKDASELRGNLTELMESANKMPASPESVGQLYAEYQALVKRQENHGRIWRRFHKDENKARTQLLQDMKKILARHLPDETLRDLSATPSDIVRTGEKENKEAHIYNGMSIRESNPAEAMGYAQYRDNPEAMNAKFTGSMTDFLKVNYRPNFNCIEDEMMQMQSLRDAITKGEVFKNNSVIKQLVTRNFMRLKTASIMGNTAEWEKYCAAQDEDFKLEHPNYEAPDKIPGFSEEKKENDSREPLDGDKLKEDIGEKNVGVEDKRPEEPTVSSPNKSIG